MSALRIPGPDGRTILRVIDDGAVGRISYSRRGISGGSGTVVYGQLAVGVSNRIGHEDGRRGREPKVGP